MADIIQSQIDKGEYRTVQEFIVTAVQNQVYLIGNPIKTVKQISELNQNFVNERTTLKRNILKLSKKNVKTFNSNPNKQQKKLSGFWNKFFPVKITVRILSNLVNNQTEYVLLDTLQEIASTEARKIGLSLVRSEKGSGRKRGDRLFTGLPVNKNIERTKNRFKSHFVGELRTNYLDGMPGTLGLLNIEKHDNGRDYVSLTPTGLEFSNFKNPYLDNNDKNSVLSKSEKDFLLKIVEKNLVEEYKEIKYLLRLIRDGKNTTGTLFTAIKKTKPESSENKITTNLSGQLNRLTDLDLVHRSYDGLNYIYIITDKGKELIV